MYDISVLEIAHKARLSQEDYIKLQGLYVALNVLDACDVGYKLLHKRQKTFEFRHKPGKGFTYFLAGFPATTMNMSVQNSSGDLVISAEEKLNLFDNYDTHLYASEQSLIERFEDFFANVFPHNFHQISKIF